MLDCAHLRHLQSRVVSRSARIHTSFFVWFYLSCCVKLCECDRLYSCSAMCMRGMHIGRFNTMKITAQVAQTTWRPNSSMSSSVLPQLLWLLWVQRILGKIRALLRLQHQHLRNQYQRVPEGSETMDLSDLNAPNDATTALPGPAPTEPAEEEAPPVPACALYYIACMHGTAYIRSDTGVRV